MRASIIIPVIRPHLIDALVSRIHETAGIPESEYEILWEVDDNRIGCPGMVKALAERAQSDKVVFLGDDTRPEQDFLIRALWYMAQLPDGWGVVSLNSGSGRPETADHWMAHKNMLDHLEKREFFFTGYEHCYCDNELSEIAQGMERYIFAEEARVEHVHPVHGTANYDEHYARAYEAGKFERDQKLFLERKIARGASKLAICLPTTNEKEYNVFWESFTRLSKPLNYTLIRPPFLSGEQEIGKQDICLIRNNLVEKALDWRVNATHILMMDTDQVYMSSGMIQRMMGHDVPFVGARVHRRYPPYDPLVKRADPDRPGEYKTIPDAEMYGGALVEADMVGAGCFMIQTPIFREMEKPWFEIGYRIPEEDNEGFVGGLLGVRSAEQTKRKVDTFLSGQPHIGEDVNFCEKMRALGYTLYADTSAEIKHMGLVPIDRAYHEVFTHIEGLARSEIERLEKEK